MKRRIAEFGIVVYNNDGQVEIAFDKARKVPKAYDSFVACIEIACLNAIQKVMHQIDKSDTTERKGNGNQDRPTDSTGNNADNQGNPS